MKMLSAHIEHPDTTPVHDLGGVKRLLSNPGKVVFDLQELLRQERNWILVLLPCWTCIVLGIALICFVCTCALSV